MDFDDKALQEKFYTEGLHIQENWLSKDLLNSLNDELDYYFSDYSINGSVFCQHYDNATKIFNNTHLLRSLNFTELMLDLVEQWKKIYPQFDEENYILTCATIKDERNGPGPIAWHTDQHLGMFRNIIYLEGAKKDSGQFRFMPKSHRMEHDIPYHMSPAQVKEHESMIYDCEAPRGSVIFFDAKGFHSNYNRVNQRRVILITFSPRNSDWGGESRMFLSSENLTDKVIKGMKYLVNTEYVHYKPKAKNLLPRDYDINPAQPLPMKVAFKYFLKSFDFYALIPIKIRIKKVLDVLENFLLKMKTRPSKKGDTKDRTYKPL